MKPSIATQTLIRAIFQPAPYALTARLTNIWNLEYVALDPALHGPSKVTVPTTAIAQIGAPAPPGIGNLPTASQATWVRYAPFFLPDRMFAITVYVAFWQGLFASTRFKTVIVPTATGRGSATRFRLRRVQVFGT